jgi:septal ring factor EnvC (AmiA/AmiB activator)
MTPKIEKIVLDYGIGDGFNVKFESVLLDFVNTIPDRKKELNSLNQQINAKKTELARFTEKCRKLVDISSSVTRVVEQIEFINKQIDGYAAG